MSGFSALLIEKAQENKKSSPKYPADSRGQTASRTVDPHRCNLSNAHAYRSAAEMTPGAFHRSPQYEHFHEDLNKDKGDQQALHFLQQG